MDLFSQKKGIAFGNAKTAGIFVSVRKLLKSVRFAPIRKAIL
jgi:hypothetical protein